MAKISSFSVHNSALAIICVILLLTSDAMAGRPLKPGPGPGRSNPVTRVMPTTMEDTWINAQKQKLMEDEVDEETCENIDKENCLIKRTLVAHTDYIYTQNHGKP